jgi:hypothetical protein
VNFGVQDPDTLLTCQTALSAMSGNTTLVPVANIVIDGSGANCTATITPAANLSGSSLITLTITDGNGSDTEDFTLTVTPVDKGGAVANDDVVTVSEDSGANLIAVLVNDAADPDDGSLSVASVGSATHGDTAIVPGGVQYAPAANYCGSDSFSYTVNGGDGATVSVTVDCVDDGAAIANDDEFTVDEDASTALNVLANDVVDPDVGGPPSTIVIIDVSDPLNGTVAFTPPGFVQYTPDANFCGDDSFTYTVSGGDTALVELTVTCVDDAPTISAIADVTVAVGVSGQASFTIADVDTALTCSATHLGATSLDTTLLPEANISFGGTAPNCTVTLTPAAGQTGSADVILTVTDGPNDAQRMFRFTVNPNAIFGDGFED